MPAHAIDLSIAEAVAECYADPLRFVRTMYPWRQSGPLQDHEGPDAWQAEFLRRLGAHVRERRFDGHAPVPPIRMAASKGHGVGGTTLLGWIVDWIMSTRPHAQGVVTANTAVQLETKTWAAIQRWTKLCLTGHWFVINSARMYHPSFKSSWFCTPQTCREENSEAFAGQHAATSTSFYIFDEDSAVPDPIHDVAEGGLTDGEPMSFRFGNPTRNTGEFFQACFGSKRDRWDVVVVDSRSSKFTNKRLIQEWMDDYGEDSDFVRVRVKGLPPNADESQFIEAARVRRAQHTLLVGQPDDPLIAGVDVSGGGSAFTVCRFRRGLDARTMPPIRLTGEQTVKDDRQLPISMLAERLQRTGKDKISAMFIDSAFGAPLVVALRNRGFSNVYEIGFGAASPDDHQANQRAYQWHQMKEWLSHGAIPPDDTRLESDLVGPGFHLNKKNQLVLEPKESMLARGLASPDDGDALSLTFAQPVSATLGRAAARPYVPPPLWS